MDFSLVLFLLVVVTGVIWALDRWSWSPARARAAKAAAQGGAGPEAVGRVAREPVYVEYARAFFPVILAVFVLRSFVVEPFRIPSGSMLPSLQVGDFILVNKFAYGLRLPVVNLEILDLGAPRRGDVAVFRFPRDESVNYIKRIVGLPGDRIEYRDKKLYVNGEPVQLGEPTSYTVQQNGEVLYEAARVMERLDGVEHAILLSPRSDYSPDEYVVPAGHYFVMGDNRDHSNDSRFWGYVPEQNMVGKAFLIWFSWDTSEAGGWFWDRIAFERIGSAIR